jgi:hypothetical protein
VKSASGKESPSRIRLELHLHLVRAKIVVL